jgi:hypothetical protein
MFESRPDVVKILILNNRIIRDMYDWIVKKSIVKEDKEFLRRKERYSSLYLRIISILFINNVNNIKVLLWKTNRSINGMF